VYLNARECEYLSPTATLSHLPALRVLDVSGTEIGDALVASLPGSLIELRLAGCWHVTADATLDHLHALRVLHCIDVELAPDTLVACRARGCAMPVVGVLRGHYRYVRSLVLLGAGRLASRDSSGEIRLWDMAVVGGEATAALRTGSEVRAMAALRNGRRLAISTGKWDAKEGCIEVWNADRVPPTRRATIKVCSEVLALAVLPDGCLAAGCKDGAVRVVDVDAGAVVATLSGHTDSVRALAILPDGALASGSHDASVRVWDVGTRACMATLAVCIGGVWSLAVLADGRLAVGGSDDGTVQVWDVGARVCVDVLSGHTGAVTALAALPDGRLASAPEDGIIRLWDTRPAAAAGASRAAGVVPSVIVDVLVGFDGALVSLPDGRLACGGGGGTICLLEVPPPAAACE